MGTKFEGGREEGRERGREGRTGGAGKGKRDCWGVTFDPRFAHVVVKSVPFSSRGWRLQDSK